MQDTETLVFTKTVCDLNGRITRYASGGGFTVRVIRADGEELNLYDSREPIEFVIAALLRELNTYAKV